MHHEEIVMSALNQLTQAPPTRHRVFWTVITIVGGLVILVPIALYLLLVVAFGFAGHRPTVGEAWTAAQSYYKAVQQRDYATAYTYVAPAATMALDGQARVIDSANALASIAQAADQKYGTITAYTPTDGNFEQGKVIVDMTMRVTRSAEAYDVHIQIGLANGKWTILRTDNM
jgi:hypothetical protein